MITVNQGKIFVEGVETTDPELIGFAVLDWVEKNPTSANYYFPNDFEQTMILYAELINGANEKRNTPERLYVLEQSLKHGPFYNVEELKYILKPNKSKNYSISQSTLYNSINFFIEHGLIRKKPVNSFL